jgi:acyl-CoA hydrolase
MGDNTVVSRAGFPLHAPPIATHLRPFMSSITLRFLAEPSTINFGGKVHGGTVMKWIDEAGYACATRWAKRYCVTVSVGSIRFQRPIMIGDLVEVQARLAYTGSTSMNIAVEVRAGDMKTGQMEVITECVVVFVAVDPNGKALPVEPWLPETPGDIALAQNVKAHLELARAAQAHP